MTRPRILLVPTTTELEWRIKPQLKEWAEVASFDAPGVGAEPPPEHHTPEAIAERGLVELDRLGWERCVIVGDEFGAVTAAQVAAARPEAVDALVLGHPSLTLRSEGDRAPINSEVKSAFIRVAKTDYGSYVRALSQLTQHAYDDEFAEAYRERVAPEVSEAYQGWLSAEREPLDSVLGGLDAPMLLVEHKGCLLFTREGYEDAVAAFPKAETAVMELKPSVNPEFAELLERFCAKLPSATAARAQRQ